MNNSDVRYYGIFGQRIIVQRISEICARKFELDHSHALYRNFHKGNQPVLRELNKRNII